MKANLHHRGHRGTPRKTRRRRRSAAHTARSRPFDAVVRKQIYFATSSVFSAPFFTSSFTALAPFFTSVPVSVQRVRDTCRVQFFTPKMRCNIPNTHISFTARNSLPNPLHSRASVAPELYEVPERIHFAERHQHISKSFSQMSSRQRRQLLEAVIVLPVAAVRFCGTQDRNRAISRDVIPKLV